MATTQPDIFTNVHKGIRRALFDTCIALGRAASDDARGSAVREQLREVLHFVAHHGENEDLVLLPLLEGRARELFERMTAAHARVGAALHTLEAAIDVAPASALYEQTCAFVALYLEHMREEEQDFDPAIRAALSVEDLATVGQRSVQRTAPADQQMMLGWMLPAMTRADVDAFLARLPPAVADAFRPLATALEAPRRLY